MTTLRLFALLVVAPFVPTRARAWLPAVLVGLFAPPLGIALAAGTAIWRWRELRRRRRLADIAVAGSLEVLGDLLVVGLSAGWGLVQTLEWIAPRLEEPLGREVGDLVRRISRDGSGSALVSADGCGQRLYRLAGRAALTGAPLVDAVEAFVDELRAERRTRDLIKARRLPVLLVFPLALLILPGFVLLTIAPAVVTSLGGLGS